MRVRLFLSCIAALLVVSPFSAHADDEQLPLVVHVIDCANVAPTTLIAAQHVLTRAFGASGITPQWREEATPPAGLGPNHVTVVILSQAMAESKAARDRVPMNALATAAPAPVRRAWIFIDRIIEAASRQRISIGDALGIVIAHEAAHMAGGVSHTAHGIMGRDLRMRADAVVGFSAEQGRRILAAMRAPVATGSLPTHGPEPSHASLRPERLEARR